MSKIYSFPNIPQTAYRHDKNSTGKYVYSEVLGLAFCCVRFYFSNKNVELNLKRNKVSNNCTCFDIL